MDARLAMDHTPTPTSPLPSRLARPFSLDLSGGSLEVPRTLRPVSESPYDDAGPGRARGYTEASSITSMPRQLNRPRASSFSVEPRDAPKAAPQLKGLYLAKFAVSVTACYIGITLLMNFAEVLLPFIFAVLLMIVLEPLKQFVLRVLFRASLVSFKKFHFKGCMETKKGGDRGSSGHTVRIGRTDSIAAAEGPVYGSLPEDSNAEDHFPDDESMRVTVPIPACQKAILFLSILFCLGVACRFMFLAAKIFVKAGNMISGDLDFYRRGANRMKIWVQAYIRSTHLEGIDWASVLDDLVKYVENIGSLVTENVVYTLLQAVVVMIFLLYMMWSPIKMESNTVMEQVLMSTAKYIKVKCLISAFTGVSVFISLWAIGLEIPAAFGFLAFLANFLPGIGSIVSSAMPCILAIIDVRKSFAQVMVALLSQMAVHFFIDFVVEPVFFGISAEIHSVVVILGIWFFYKVWGGAGMLLSVPLLAVMRLLLKSVTSANVTAHGEDAETLVFLDNILEGRWMSSVGADEDDVDGEHFIESSKSNIQLSLPEESQPPPERNERGGFWQGAEQEVNNFYQQHRLSLDLLGLLGMVIVLFIIPI